MGMSGLMLIFAHTLGPKRHGPVKDDTYESGMTPATDARRRFNVRFYLVAVMYVVFGVEVVVLYPWAVLFAQERAGTDGVRGRRSRRHAGQGFRHGPLGGRHGRRRIWTGLHVLRRRRFLRAPGSRAGVRVA